MSSSFEKTSVQNGTILTPIDAITTQTDKAYAPKARTLTPANMLMVAHFDVLAGNLYAVTP